MSCNVTFHINQLKNNPLNAERHIKVLAEHIEEAIKNENFFKIDYEKYAKQIIERSNACDEKKEEITKSFLNHSEIKKEANKPGRLNLANFAMFNRNQATTINKPEMNKVVSQKTINDKNNPTIQFFNTLPINEQLIIISKFNNPDSCLVWNKIQNLLQYLNT